MRDPGLSSPDATHLPYRFYWAPHQVRGDEKESLGYSLCFTNKIWTLTFYLEYNTPGVNYSTMNAFIYLKNLIDPQGSLEILRTSPRYPGDLSFYDPDFKDTAKLKNTANIKSIQTIDGFWNITFTDEFWNHQLIDFLQRPPLKIKAPLPESFWLHQFENFYNSLSRYYKETFGKDFVCCFDETPDLTNSQDLAIIKYIIQWEFSHIILKNKTQNIESFIQVFFDWGRSNKIKGAVLRIIDPNNRKKTNERMLVPKAYHKILKDIES